MVKTLVLPTVTGYSAISNEGLLSQDVKTFIPEENCLFQKYVKNYFCVGKLLKDKLETCRDNCKRG